MPDEDSPAPGTNGTPAMTVSARSYDGERRSHRHDFFQILLPERGRLELLVEGSAGAVDGTRLAFVPSGAEHAYWSEGGGPNRFLVADLSPILVAAARRRATPAPLPAPFLPMGPRFAAVAMALRTEVAQGGLADPLLAETLGLYLAAAVLRLPPEPASTAAGVSAAGRRLARRTEAFLRANATAPLAVADVAAAVGASPSHLQRAFRAHAGCSLVAFVHRLRLERAQELLRETDLSVLEVAAAVGFASQSHLARLFARHLGVSPSRYRALAAARAGSGKTRR